MSKLPVWARKPSHKKEVVATDRGWVVKETGEILRRVSDLPTKLRQLVDETREIETLIEKDHGVEYTVKAEEPEEPSEPESPVVSEPVEQGQSDEEKTEETQAEPEQPKKTTKGKKKSYYQRKKEQEASK
jgi:uncharacterized membrane protein